MQALLDPVIAYCGPAALPADLWQRWNFDPLLIGGLVMLAVWSAAAAAPMRAPAGRRSR